MKEDFLHYLWQYQKFDKSNLLTTENQQLRITATGFHNTDSGPDFLDARLQIGDMDWAGSVEIHLNASDWLAHRHQYDKAYDNVILHVVWEADIEINNSLGMAIPCLVLEKITRQKILHQYQYLMKGKSQIPCEKLFSTVHEIRKIDMLEKVLIHRIERKGEDVSLRYKSNKNDWEETAYQSLVSNFGFKLNNAAFLSLSERLPFLLLRNYADASFQLEALLFGMAGFLESGLDEYGLKLKKEFDFLATKHKLHEHKMELAQWKFMRTRPGNFPTIRLSQLAALISQSKSLFSVFTEIDNFKGLIKFFNIKPSEYWQHHYQFGNKSQIQFKGIGKPSIHMLVINTVVPLLVAYSKSIDNPELMSRAISFLEEIPAEKNRITKFWKTMGMPVQSMFDSQGSLELYNEFCKKKKCLSCGIGVSVLS